MKLGVNIDHVATLRQARKALEPDPVEAARICESAGCDSIVVHLREDRRHINDGDLKRLRKSVKTRLNLEMSIAREIVDIACRVKPDQATLVPERRKELTTEGGLDVKGGLAAVSCAVRQLKRAGISVSLFIDPDKSQIKAAKLTGAEAVEIHTGGYANAKTPHQVVRELAKIKEAIKFANSLGFIVNAGHGLTYENVKPIAKISGIEELNIGHSIVSMAVLVGLREATRKMKELTS